MRFILAVLIMLSLPAFAEQHPCDISENVVVGNKSITVQNPLELLRQARATNNARKTSAILTENFGCHPVLEIVAKDNGMTCGEFLVYTGILVEFNAAFDQLKDELDPGEIGKIYQGLLQQVVDDIVDQILTPRQEV